jgi:hypothetical protein
MKKRTSVGRYGKVEEIASAAAFSPILIPHSLTAKILPLMVAGTHRAGSISEFRPVGRQP